MLVLGIESTCDETGIALVADGKEILANEVASQGELHSHYGGVIPELACRRHIEACLPLLHRALSRAQVDIEEIDLIAVAHGPGLIGALLIGTQFAKGLSLGLEKPLVSVNHVHAHLYAAQMSSHQLVEFPALGVVVSGAHTALLRVENWGAYTLIGETQDDALGEAFDKVAQLLGMTYPGGPKVEELAKQGVSSAFPLKPCRVKGRPYDFSFSGLKTAVLYGVKGQNSNKHSISLIDEGERKNIAASFQQTAFKDILQKTIKAAQEYECRAILVGGGVTRNEYLRSLFENSRELPPLFWPSKDLSLDNAAMIAGLGYHLYKSRGATPLSLLEAIPRIPLAY